MAKTSSLPSLLLLPRFALGLSLVLGIGACSSGGSDSPGTGGRGGGSGAAGSGGNRNDGTGGSISGSGGGGGHPSPAGTGGVSSTGGASSGGGSGGPGGGGAGGSGSAGTSGGGASGLARPVTMNDVSILFPLGTVSDDSTGHLRADSPGSRGALFPASIFQNIAIEGSVPPGGGRIGGISTAPYANMRVVALRLDPCFADRQPTSSSTTCRNQLRLVFQELEAATTGVRAFDSGVHALYSITRGELLAMVNEIVRLREAAGGGGEAGRGPLAPHPLMVQQGLSGTFSRALQKLILQYAGEQNLVRATALTAVNSGFSWDFFGFDVTGATPMATPIAIATLTATGSTMPTRESFNRGFATNTDPMGMFTPKPAGPDDFTILADAQAALALPAADKAKLVNALARVDSPAVFTADTLDCARCHTATPLGQNVVRDRLHLSESADPDAFKPDGHWVTADEMKTTDFTFGSATNLLPPIVNVHAFSYANDVPSINQRTVNETAAVVQFLNDSFYRAQ